MKDLEKNKELDILEITSILMDINIKVKEYLEKIPIGNSKKCNESNNFMFYISSKYGFYYHPMTTQDLKNDDLFHKFGLAVFNLDYNPIIYLVDFTYNQFLNNNDNKTPANFINKDLLNKLITDGYLPFTKDIFNDYIMSFAKANDCKNSSKFLNSIYSDFEKCRIEFNNSEDYNCDIKGIKR